VKYEIIVKYALTISLKTLSLPYGETTTNSENLMLESQIIDDFVPKFREFINRVGGTVQGVQKQPSRPGPDLLVRAEIRGNPITLIAEAKSQGEPRYIRQAADQLREYASQFPGAYPIVVSTFISPGTAEILRSRDIGYFDMAGNALIDFGPLFINISGKPNRNPVQKTLRSLFADKSSRILRVLLTNPARSWTVQDLSAEAGVSIGLTSRVKQKLIDFELMPETKSAIKLTNPGELLDQWRNAYSYEKNEITKYYSSSTPSEIEKRIANFAGSRGTPYQLTMFSGATRVAAFVRYNFAAFYFSGSILELEQELGISPTSSGANVWVFRPFDEGVYYGMQNREGMSIASNVQLYLDLFKYKGRGEEQATAIRERVLRY
jgi:AraC-like DNA-binding protein